MSKRKKEKFQPENNSGITLVRPRNEQQTLLENSIFNNPITVVAGPAGVGKTLFSIQTLYRMYCQGKLDSIKIVRLISKTHDEDVGALPGELIEKLWGFAGPIVDNLLQVIPEGDLREMFNNYKIEVLPVSRVRGRSFIRTGVLIEEAQNMNSEMIITCMTRIGEGSRFVFNGDPMQCDFFDGRNGITYAMKVSCGIEDIGIVEFEDNQVERHPIIYPILQNAKALSHYDDIV